MVIIENSSTNLVHMKRFLSPLKPLRAAGLAVIGLVLVLLALGYVFFFQSKEQVYSLKLSTGRIVEPPKRHYHLPS